MAALFPVPIDYDTDAFRPRPRSVRDGRRYDARQSSRATGGVRRRPLPIRAIAAMVVGGLVVILGLGAMLAVIDAASQPPAVPPAAVTAVGGAGGDGVIVVQSGDTLTSIARRLRPTGDIGALVDELAALHGPAALQPGERLDVGSLGSAS